MLALLVTSTASGVSDDDDVIRPTQADAHQKSETIAGVFREYVTTNRIRYADLV